MTQGQGAFQTVEAILRPHFQKTYSELLAALSFSIDQLQEVREYAREAGDRETAGHIQNTLDDYRVVKCGVQNIRYLNSDTISEPEIWKVANVARKTVWGLDSYMTAKKTPESPAKNGEEEKMTSYEPCKSTEGHDIYEVNGHRIRFSWGYSKDGKLGIQNCYNADVLVEVLTGEDEEENSSWTAYEGFDFEWEGKTGYYGYYDGIDWDAYQKTVDEILSRPDWQ